MKVIHGTVPLRKEVNIMKKKGYSIGFVPTMGYLHEGHLSLLRAACRECSFSVMSIFVNPLQFGQNEDYQKYPRDLSRDRFLAEQNGCNLLFAPHNNDIYPEKTMTQVYVKELSEYLCGKDRPGHFAGVTTVVNILFNIVQPDVAFFGQKDAQQVIILKKMAADLHMPLKIMALPTIRDSSGLALSSRNKYLSPREKEAAALIYEGLMAGNNLLAKGERESAKILAAIQQTWQKEALIKKEYLQVADLSSLLPVEKIERPVLVAAAVKIGKTRLIDNIVWPEGSLTQQLQNK